MKTSLALISLFCFFAQSLLGQEEYQHINSNKLDRELRNTRNFTKQSPGVKQHNIRIGESELPVSMLKGQNPNERQIDVVKNVLSEDFLVNDDTTYGSVQSSPAIVMDPLGNFVVTWMDLTDGNNDIYYQRYNSSGVALGTDTKVNDDTVRADQRNPAIAMDFLGNFVVTWGDERNGDYDIFYQRYNSSGVALGTNTKVNDNAGSALQYYPAIAMDLLGNFVVTWTDNRNGNYDIYYQRYNSDGVAQGTNTKANDDAGSFYQSSPAIAMDSQGNFVIAWEDYRTGHSDIYHQRYNSSGLALGTNTKVNDGISSTYKCPPAIAMNSQGNFVIAWIDKRNGNWDIYYQRYNAGDIAQGTNTKANDDAGSAIQFNPAIAMDSLGNFVIVWEDYRFGAGYPDIIGQRFFANGNANGSNYRIVKDGPNYGEMFPVVACNSTSIIFSWQDNRRLKGVDVYGGWDIYGKITGWDWNGVTSITDNGNSLPEKFVLSQNYPNPFNPVTKIKFNIPCIGANRCSHVQLKVYDILGNEIATLLNEEKPAGNYSIDFDAGNLPSGVYFYRLKAGEFVETKKMILLR